MGAPDDASGGRSSRAFACGLAALLALAAGLRLWGLDAGLPNLRTRPDEIEVLRQTALPARGELRLDWSVYPNAYVYLTWLWGEAALRGSRAFGAATDAGYGETLVSDPARILLLTRGLSAAAGVATVGLLVAIARRPLGGAAALGAGALLATSFLHARDSHFVKPEALLGLALVGALGAMLPLARRATPARGALAGLAVGAAAAAKYPGAVLLVPAWLAAAWGSPKQRWRRLLTAPAAAVAAAAAAFFCATSPQILLDPATRAAAMGLPGLVFPDLFPQQLAGGTMHPGLEGPGPSPYAGPGALAAVYHARFSLWFGAGALATILAPAAVAWGLAVRRPLPTLAAVTCLTWYAVIGASRVCLARYATPMLAPLLLLEAGLLSAAAQRFAPRAPRAAFAAAIALLAADPLVSALAHDRILSRPDTRVLATEWMRRELPVGARVAVHGTRFWPWGEPILPPRARRVHADPVAASLEAAGASHLVVHDHPLFWSSADAAALALLAPRLHRIAEFVPFAADARPVFETADAYYAPFAGFAGVERAGPTIRIYELR